MDKNYLKTISEEDQKYLRWIATNYPRPITREQLPKYKTKRILKSWKEIPYFDSDKKTKIFPTKDLHKFACLKFGFHILKFEKGIPADSYKMLGNQGPPKSVFKIYEFLYSHSYYNSEIKKRLCYTRNKLIAKKLGISEITVRRSTKILMESYWIFRLQKGVPEPTHPSGYLSIYELPKNYKHIIYWRTNKHKKKKKIMKEKGVINYEYKR